MNSITLLFYLRKLLVKPASRDATRQHDPFCYLNSNKEWFRLL